MPGPLGALSPYRVIDLTTGDSRLCAKLLADLGADVLAVEPPGGDPGRRVGRFPAGREGDPEANLEQWFAAAGKRSVVVDLNEPTGRAELHRLVAGADALIESYGPGGLAARTGLTADALAALNPHLVVTSISAFGSDGPYASWTEPVPDLFVNALAGEIWLNGDDDRPPVRVSVPQAMRVAALEAALHTVVALQHAARSGQGQHADVAAQPAMVRTLMNATEFKAIEGRELTRAGSRVAYSPFSVRMVFACADGHVTFLPTIGPLAGPGLVWLRETAAADGFAVPPILAEANVLDAAIFRDLVVAGRSQEFIAAIEATVEATFARRTKAELYRTAIEKLLLLAPLNTVADLRDDGQLAAREFWATVRQADGTVTTQPGPWARLAATPLRVGQRAPQVGEHTAEVQAEPPRQPVGRAAAEPGRATGDPFAGLKVWDMSWVGVGPLTARYLADYGATVVRLDNTVRADVLRVNPPSLGGVAGINRSQFYADFNASKLGIGLDLAHPKGRDLALRLAAWADVVVESFTPKTLAGFGLDYEQLRAVNPQLVMLSTCMQGQTGPRRNYRGFGQLMGSLCGFYQVTGWPDRDPAMVYGAYTDFLCQRMCATALVAALDHRRRTGQGQHIDVSQLEASLQVLGPELSDFDLNGVVATRNGNRDPHAAPHGVYPCRPVGPAPADERWVAIVCADDHQWETLVERLGRPAWAQDGAWATLAGRKAGEDELDRRLAEWTAPRERDEVVRLLGGPGRPGDARPPSVVPVLSPDELHDDPQLTHLGYFVPLDHPVLGTQRYNGMQARLSVTPGRLRKAGPCLGEDTLTVLADLLGCSDDEIGELLAEEAVEMNLG